MKNNNLINLDNIKKIQLDILNYVVQVCQELEINYFLAGGTVLGAVRHQGFIPWDDDIDITMPREDFNKLQDYFAKKENPKYELLSINNNNKYYYPFLKVINKNTILIEKDVPLIEGMGIYVDIFPIDGTPNNKIIFKIHYLKIRILKTLLYLSYLEFHKTNSRVINILKKSLMFLAKTIGSSKIINSLNRIASKYKFEESKNVGVLVAGYGLKEVFPKKIYETGQKLLFEGAEFNVPSNYDLYLTRLYGNYMKLPPVEKRVNHSFTSYWK